MLYSESDVYNQAIKDLRPPPSPPFTGFIVDPRPSTPCAPMQLRLPSFFFDTLAVELPIDDTLGACSPDIIAAMSGAYISPYEMALYYTAKSDDHRDLMLAEIEEFYGPIQHCTALSLEDIEELCGSVSYYTALRQDDSDEMPALHTLKTSIKSSRNTTRCTSLFYWDRI
jgi:hypothetical protein